MMKDFYSEYKQRLLREGVSEPDAKLTELISFVTGAPYSEVRTQRLLGDIKISEAQVSMLDALTGRLIDGEPLQYITGRTDFYGYTFHTRENVLIPRFDTETLVDEVLKRIPEGGRLLDLCTGSGCVGITAALQKNVKAMCADISPYALELAKENAHLLGADALVEVICHDVLNDLPDALGKFDVIASNPPYIPTCNTKTLAKDVLHEPMLALDGGDDGLMFYRAIAKKYKRNLLPDGYIAVECGIRQSPDVEEIFRQNGFINICTAKDAAGIDRAVIAQYKQ